MKALGNAHNYVSENRPIEVNLLWHKTRMNELILEGKDEKVASQKAYEECLSLTQTKKKKDLKKKGILKEGHRFLRG